MSTTRPSRSFDNDGGNTITGPTGQRAHAAHFEHGERLAPQLYTVRPGVWTLVGNGLSNQTFVEGPEGVIAIDTSECVQEMAAALAALRTVCDRPVVAVLYTHFHYVNGTQAILDEASARGGGGGVDSASIPIHGHERIADNLRRATTEIGPTYMRGIVQQFAVVLPADGPDGAVNVGLGRHFRNPAHAPFTGGHLPVTHPFGDDPVTLRVAGLDVHVQHAPSDADDSVTYWFPALGVAVHNIVWPVLFNVYAIRGEAYRDPRVLLTGIDHLLSLGAEHLVCAHGQPISGRDEIRRRVTGSRDAIQFLWDQTVRLTNHGLGSVEIGHAVHLPDHCDDDPLTSEFYGVAEHHVRQIRSGLFGFFDDDPANLFPLPPDGEAQRMLAALGGRAVVRGMAAQAIADDDLRWAVRLASWLARGDDAEGDDRQLLADGLRLIGQRSSAANIRSWCLTRARELEGALSLDGFRQHRFHPLAVLMKGVAESVPLLRVMLDPVRAAGADVRLAWFFDDGASAGLHVRNCVAVPCAATDDADAVLSCAPEVWADVLGGVRALSAAVESGALRVSGDVQGALRALATFDVEGLRS